MKDIEFWIDWTYYREKEEIITIFQKSFEKKIDFFVSTKLVLARRIFFPGAGETKVITKRYYFRNLYGIEENELTKKVTNYHPVNENFYTVNEENNVKALYMFDVNITHSSNVEGKASTYLMHSADGKSSYLAPEHKYYMKIITNNVDIQQVKKNLKGSKVDINLTREFNENKKAIKIADDIAKTQISKHAGVSVENIHNVTKHIVTQRQADEFLNETAPDLLKDINKIKD